MKQIIPYHEIGITDEQIQEVREKSRLFTVGEKLLIASTGAQLMTPILTFLAVLSFSAINALAQASTTGPVFTPDNGQAGRTIVNFIRIIYTGLFVLGFVAVAKAIWNVFSEKEWSRPAIAAVCCWAAGLIAAAVYKMSKGESVDIDVNELGGY